MDPPALTNGTNSQLDETTSGLLYTLHLKREPTFFWVFYILPAILFVMLSYSSFWIDKTAVPARVGLRITTTLITLNMMVSTHKYLPQINYITWMNSFLNGILVFTVVSMIQFGALNFCSTSYAEMRKEIDNQIDMMSAPKANSSALQVLQAKRKVLQGKPNNSVRDRLVNKQVKASFSEMGKLQPHFRE